MVCSWFRVCCGLACGFAMLCLSYVWRVCVRFEFHVFVCCDCDGLCGCAWRVCALCVWVGGPLKLLVCVSGILFNAVWFVVVCVLVCVCLCVVLV